MQPVHLPSSSLVADCHSHQCRLPVAERELLSGARRITITPVIPVGEEDVTKIIGLLNKYLVKYA